MRIAVFALACLFIAAPTHAATLPAYDFSAALPANIRDTLAVANGAKAAITNLTVNSANSKADIADFNNFAGTYTVRIKKSGAGVFFNLTADTLSRAESNITVNNSHGGPAGIVIAANGTGSSAEQYLSIQAKTIGTPPASVGVIRFQDTALTHPTLGEVFCGMAGENAKDYGGYCVIQTKKENGTGTMQENLVADHQGHLSIPGTVFSTTVTTPSSCASLANCGTVTFTFPSAFLTPTGAAEVPYCSNASVQDTSIGTDMWLASVNAVSSTSVTYNYASLAAISGAKSLKLVFSCTDSAY